MKDKTLRAIAAEKMVYQLLNSQLKRMQVEVDELGTDKELPSRSEITIMVKEVRHSQKW